MNSSLSFRVLGIDPGITNGFALATVVPEEKEISWVVWEVPIEDFSYQLIKTDAHVVVVEDFILRPDKRSEFMNRGFTSLETAKLVGRVEQYCYEHSKLRVLAQASDKKFAYQLIQMTYVKGKKNMHKMDAQAHCRHYIRKRWSF